MSKAIILGTGLSAKHYKYQYGDWVLGINDAIKLGHDLDAICFTDKWKRVISTRPAVLRTPNHVKKFANFGDCNLPNSERVSSKRHTFNGKFSIDRTPLSHGFSSAIYAICIACHWGYKKIDVYGVDLINHEICAEFKSKKIDIESVPTLIESGLSFNDWVKKYCLTKAIGELRMLREYLDSKKIKLTFAKKSPIARIINID